MFGLRVVHAMFGERKKEPYTGGVKILLRAVEASKMVRLLRDLCLLAVWLPDIRAKCRKLWKANNPVAGLCCRLQRQLESLLVAAPFDYKF